MGDGKVLIVDNDNDTLEIMRDVLEYSGFEVVTSAGTEDIHDMINLHDPDLLLIDYILDGINGGEICCELKRNKATQHLAVVIVSAYGRVIHSLGNYNCDAFIPKPFDLEELSSTLKTLIHNVKTSSTVHNAQ